MKIWLKRLAVVLPILSMALLTWLVVRETRHILSRPANSWVEDQTADCAVVLTGGPYRVREGFDLLSRRSIQKLIISGVHPNSSLREIFPQWPYYGRLREEDVILERRSQTTFGNAQQSLALLEALQCRDFILITSRVHMYRASRTFRAEIPPNLSMYPRAIVAGTHEPKFADLFIEVFKSLFYSAWAY